MVLVIHACCILHNLANAEDLEIFELPIEDDSPDPEANNIVRGVFKKLGDFVVLSKNTYLLISIYVFPFKVIPVRYNTLVPALFPIIEALLIIILRYSFEFFQRCSFYLLNR